MKALLPLVIIPLFAICGARYIVNWLLGQLLFVVWVASLGATFHFALVIHHQAPGEEKCVIAAVLLYPAYLWVVRVVWFTKFHRWYVGRMGCKGKG